MRVLGMSMQVELFSGTWRHSATAHGIDPGSLSRAAGLAGRRVHSAVRERHLGIDIVLRRRSAHLTDRTVLAPYFVIWCGRARSSGRVALVRGISWGGFWLRTPQIMPRTLTVSACWHPIWALA